MNFQKNEAFLVQSQWVHLRSQTKPNFGRAVVLVSGKMDKAEERSPLLNGKVYASTKVAYALGHIFNDLTAAMWFSYTLIYFQRVALLEPITAGALLLLGKGNLN